MCQIMFSPDALLPSKADFWSANEDNPDGIGVMSAAGVVKFFGKRQVRRAWNYVAELSEQRFAFGVHFRYGTAGLRNRDNVHPFMSATGVLWMHNGVFRQASLYDSTGIRSDTAMFVDCLAHIDDPSRYLDLIEHAIGAGNKLLSYAPAIDSWQLFNESLGDWDQGIWYSNAYSRANWQQWVASVSGGSRYGNGYVYDYDEKDLKGSNACTVPAQHKGVTSTVEHGTGRVLTVYTPSQAATALGYSAGRAHGEAERMALMDATRSDSPVKDRLADCGPCSSVGLKTCCCSSSFAGVGSDPALGDIVIDALDRAESLDERQERLERIESRMDAMMSDAADSTDGQEDMFSDEAGVWRLGA